MEVVLGFAVVFCIVLLFYVLASLAGSSDSAASTHSVIHGNTAERMVARQLATLDRQAYSVLHGLLIPSSGKTPTTQIDHVIVSTHGIFCIETKSTRGYIFGSDRPKHWTQVLNPRSKYPFPNPLHQNYGHVKSLERILGQRLKVPIVPITVFPLAERVKYDGKSAVCNRHSLLETISRRTSAVYTPEQCAEIIQAITAYNNPSPQARAQHITSVRMLHPQASGRQAA